MRANGGVGGYIINQRAPWAHRFNSGWIWRWNPFTTPSFKSSWFRVRISYLSVMEPETGWGKKDDFSVPLELPFVTIFLWLFYKAGGGRDPLLLIHSTTGWLRHKENMEVVSYLFQTGKTQEICCNGSFTLHETGKGTGKWWVSILCYVLYTGRGTATGNHCFL